jgi:membrane protease subunit HflK
MPTGKRLEHTALLGLVLQAAFLLVCWVAYGQSGSVAAQAEVWHLGAGLIVWLLVLVHGRQRRLAHQEREELDRLRQGRLSEEIFEEMELDTMRASSTLVAFEKYAVPIVTIGLSALLGYSAYSGFARVQLGAPRLVADQVTLSLILAVMISFGGFVVGWYSARLGQLPDYRLLRAAGSYMLGNVFACVLVAVALAMYHFGATWGDPVVAYMIPGAMAIVAAELLLNLVLDVYRPRVPGKERRPPYDSRLLGVVSEPGGIWRTVASTLDYQFGFKVSETWFYQFMERAIVPLLLVQVLALWLLTSIVVVDAGEAAFIEVMGRPRLTAEDAARGVRASVMGPGWHLKWPWPIGVARVMPAYENRVFQVGKIYEPEFGVEWADFATAIPMASDPDIILWRERHIHHAEGQEVNFIVPGVSTTPEAADLPRTERPAADYGIPEESPVAAAAAVYQAGEDTPGLASTLDEGLLAAEGAVRAPEVSMARVDATVHYRLARLPEGTVDEEAAYNYVYAQTELERHLRQLAFRAVCRIAASQDFLRWLSDQREDTSTEFQGLLREAIERENLGVEVVFAGFQVVHPPPEAAARYEDVVAALIDREGLVLGGEIDQVKMIADARTRAFASKAMARSHRYARVESERAGSELFLAQLAAFRKAPAVYALRSYFRAMADILANQRIYVLPRMASEVDIIDLTEVVRPELLTLTPTEE